MTPAEIAAAARERLPTIRPDIRTTPLRLIGDPHGTHAFVKSEHAQVTGSFKVRGALSKLSTLHADQRAAGVVAASTGNHGAAMAYAGQITSTPVTVFVPDTASTTKLDRMRSAGAAIVMVPGDPIEAERTARRHAEAHGCVYVSPYNDVDVVIGQATVGVELTRQLPAVDTVVVAVGGGGLISGVASAVLAARSTARIIGVAAEHSRVMVDSVAAGRVLDQASLPTLSDGTAGGLEPDTITFELCRTLVDDWVSVPEVAIEAMLASELAAHPLEPIEGAAALALAGWRAMADHHDLGVAAVISCGANIDEAVAQRVLADGARAAAASARPVPQ